MANKSLAGSIVLCVGLLFPGAGFFHGAYAEEAADAKPDVEALEQRAAGIEDRLAELNAQIRGHRQAVMERNRTLMDARREAMEEDEEIRALAEQIERAQQTLMELTQRYNARLSERVGLALSEEEMEARQQKVAAWSRERHQLLMEQQQLWHRLGRDPPGTVRVQPPPPPQPQPPKVEPEESP